MCRVTSAVVCGSCATLFVRVGRIVPQVIETVFDMSNSGASMVDLVPLLVTHIYFPNPNDMRY